MSKYAADTTVPAEKSRLEIETVVQKYGATGFYYAAEQGRAIVGFTAQARTVKFILPLQVMEDFAYHLPRGAWSKTRRTKEAQQKAYEQALRTKWRCMLLAIKAKLEVVESGISTFEQEFLAHIMMADGSTVGQRVAPQIEAEYQTGRPMPLMLGEGR